MKTKLIAMVLLAGSTMFAGERFGGEVRFGEGVHARVEIIQPPCPGPGYVWSNGYWVAPRYDYGYRVGERRFDDHRVVRGNNFHDNDRGYRR